MFFFAKLWRRSGILTDVEFIEFRYSGKSASFLRGFKAIYLGLFMNCIIMGWVNLAMGKILLGMFPEYVNDGNVIYFLALASSVVPNLVLSGDFVFVGVIGAIFAPIWSTRMGNHLRHVGSN